jgi:hypothetical protein
MEPLGIADEVYIGVPEAQDSRCVMISGDGELRDNRRELRIAGLPSGGGYGTARGITAQYQMLLNGGTLHGRRIVSPRLIAYVVEETRPARCRTRRWAARRCIAASARTFAARATASAASAPSAHRACSAMAAPARLLVGRPDQRRVVQLHDQPLRRRALAHAAASTHRQHRARGDQLISCIVPA